MKDQIRQRLDLYALVSEYVALKPAGPNRFKGLSPFSKEKTPSFNIDVAKGLYYCFSTKQGGDAFDFLMKVEGISFREAMEKLAARTGVEIEAARPEEKQRRDLFEVNKLAQDFFQLNLIGEPKEYFLRRGVSQTMIEQFALGFAPQGFDNLLKYAKARGVSERELLDAGLLSEAADTGRIYDRFRNRVMFPIRDYLGRVIAFGGRVLDDSKPKYLNSPETPVFKKGETLYGLDMARKHIQETGEAIVVEGYMDVIAMHQHGFTGATASLGTALTLDHAHLLARQGTRKLALLFDNDAAGQRATLQGLDQEIGRMFLVRAVSLEASGGKDASEILQADGDEILTTALNGGYSEVEFRLHAALEKFDASSMDGKKQILQELLPALRPRDVFDPVALELRRLVVDRLGLEHRMVDEWLNVQNSARPRVRAELDKMQLLAMTGKSGDELRLAKLLIQNPALTAKLDGEAEFENPLVSEVIRVARFANAPGDIIEHFRGRPEASILFEGIFTAPEEMLPERADIAALQISSRQRENDLKQQLAQVKLKLVGANQDEQLEIARQCSELQRSIEAERRLRLRN